MGRSLFRSKYEGASHKSRSEPGGMHAAITMGSQVSGFAVCTRMARLDAETSNQLFEVLEEWNTVLEHRKSKDFPVPPCP